MSDYRFSDYELSPTHRGAMLREAREARGETLEDVAAAYGTYPEDIAEVEQAAWYEDELVAALASRYNFALEQLFFGDREIAAEHRIAFLRAEVYGHTNVIASWQEYKAEWATYGDPEKAREMLETVDEWIGDRRASIELLEEAIAARQLELVRGRAPIVKESDARVDVADRAPAQKHELAS